MENYNEIKILRYIQLVASLPAVHDFQVIFILFPLTVEGGYCAQTNSQNKPFPVPGCLSITLENPAGKQKYIAF